MATEGDKSLIFILLTFYSGNENEKIKNEDVIIVMVPLIALK